MSTALRHLPLISPEEYLAGEEAAKVKHEYLNGVVHAMAGAKNRHNVIATNILGALHARLRGKPCRPFNSDTKVRIAGGDDLRFYYPDAMIVCRQRPLDFQFQDEPAVVFEVRSAGTERVDLGEKREGYCSVPTLEAYVLVHDEQRAVTVWRRRGERWESEYYTEPAETVAFASAGCELTVAEIYEGADL